MFGKPRFEYEPVSSALSTRSSLSLEADNEESKGFMTGAPLAKRAIRRPLVNRAAWIVTALDTLMFLASVCLVGPWYYRNYLPLNPERRQASTYSPIFDVIDLESRPMTVNASVWPKEEHSIAREAPNSASDELWREWEYIRIFPVTKAQIIRMGKDPSTAAKLEDEDWSMGDDAYAAGFDVLHQLHCLNSLRKLAYREYYNETAPIAGRPGLREVHLNHCVDVLMQALQCSGNVNLTMYHWMDPESQDHPQPDMSVNRECINFDKLTECRRQSTLNMSRWRNTSVMRKPKGPGVKYHPQADMFYDYFNVSDLNPNHIGGVNLDDDFPF